MLERALASSTEQMAGLPQAPTPLSGWASLLTAPRELSHDGCASVAMHDQGALP